MKWLVPLFASGLCGSCLGSLIGYGLKQHAVNGGTVVLLAGMAGAALLIRIVTQGWLSR